MFRKLITQVVPEKGRLRVKNRWLFWSVGLSLVLGGLFPAGQVRATTLTNASAEPVLMLEEDGLLPIPLEVPKLRTTEECMKCHKEPNLASGRLDGSQALLQVDAKIYQQTLHAQKLECVDCHEDAAAARHCRSGFAKVNCLACHSDSEGLFPLGARKRLAEKGIKIPKRKLMTDSYYLQTKHGKALLAGKKDAPNCYDCHTRHYIFGARIEQSTVNRANLTETCGVCHKERKLSTMLERLSTFRLEAHRKGDLSFDYDRGNCLDCHQGEAAHGEKVSEAPCARCHDTKRTEKEISLAGLGPFHLYPDYEKQYPVWCLRNFYGLSVLLLLVGAAGALLLFVLYRSAGYYRKEGGE